MSAQLRFGTLTPALLTKRSMRPCLARICSATLVTSAAIETSSGVASALPPFLVIFATTWSSASLRRPDTTTVQPSAASASAPASPMPLPPPVTQATRFPPFVMQSVSVAFQRAFLLLQPPGTALPGTAPGECCMNTAANANLFSRLFDSLDDPNRLAIETLDGQRITYGDLIARVGRMANVLVARGVKPGDRVAAQIEKSVENLVLYLAVVRAGAVYLPLNTAYTLNELDYFITDAEPSLVVCDPAKTDGIGAIAAKVGAKVETLGADGKGSLTDAAAKAPAQFETVARADDDLAAILYTSGTTGRSKGAMLTHDNLASNSLSLVDYWRFTDKDVRTD